MKRIETEQRTVSAMIRVYCADAHAGSSGLDGPSGLCHECSELDAYAHARLEKCPYGEQKPSCKQCPVHCYKPDRRETIREVMRRAGPKMLCRHPWLAIRHLWLDRFGPAPKAPPRRSAQAAR